MSRMDCEKGKARTLEDSAGLANSCYCEEGAQREMLSRKVYPLTPLFFEDIREAFCVAPVLLAIANVYVASIDLNLMQRARKWTRCGYVHDEACPVFYVSL